MATPTRNSRRYYYLQLLCALSGTLLSLYLVVQHTRLKSGIQESASFCTFGKYANCDVVNSSQFSEIAGIPIASLGASFYFTCLVLGLLGAPQTGLHALFQRIITWLATAGLGVDLFLLGVQLFALNTVCLFCLFTKAMTVGILWTAGLMHPSWRQGIGTTYRTLLFSRENPFPKGAKLSRPLLGAGAVALISFLVLLGFIPSFVKIKSDQYTVIDNALEQFYAHWKERPAKKIEWSKEDGTLGNPDAKVQIVEFSDFECPHCQKAAFTLHTILPQLSDRVFFVFKHFPLDKSCNPLVQYQMHENACALARLAFCAREKGKFWEFHDLLFLKLVPETLKEPMDSLMTRISPLFRPEETKSCLRSEKSLRRISNDIKLGTQLGVRGTPSIFINGKHVTVPLTHETIHRLVDIEEEVVRVK